MKLRGQKSIFAHLTDANFIKIFKFFQKKSATNGQIRCT